MVGTHHSDIGLALVLRVREILRETNFDAHRSSKKYYQELENERAGMEISHESVRDSFR